MPSPLLLHAGQLEGHATGRVNNLVAIDLQAANAITEGRLKANRLSVGELRSEASELLVTSQAEALASVTARTSGEEVRLIDREAVDHANLAVAQRRSRVTSEVRELQIRLLEKLDHLRKPSHQ